MATTAQVTTGRATPAGGGLPAGGAGGGLSRRAKTGVAAAAVLFVAVALLVTGLRSGPVLGSPDFTIDPEFGIPTPPHDTPYRSTANLVATSAMTLVGLIGVALGIREWFRTRSLLPLMIAVSGVFIAFPEVFFDVMGAVYFPWSESNHAYTILGREMPYWILAGWFGYGAFNFFTFKVLMSNPKTKTLWLMWGGAALGDVFFEEILLATGVYHYYGNQPLMITPQLPWWWIPCNSVGVFLAASIAYRYREQMRGWKALGMVVITPMSVGAVYGFIALPSWIATNSTLPWLPTQLLGLVTIALGVVAYCLILHNVLGRPPFAMDFVPGEREPRAATPAAG